jgi:GTP-dependent phosphoenolpyruvate carboxykinase
MTEEFYDGFGERIPDALREQLAALRTRLTRQAP